MKSEIQLAKYRYHKWQLFGRILWQTILFFLFLVVLGFLLLIIITKKFSQTEAVYLRWIYYAVGLSAAAFLLQLVVLWIKQYKTKRRISQDLENLHLVKVDSTRYQKLLQRLPKNLKIRTNFTTDGKHFYTDKYYNRDFNFFVSTEENEILYIVKVWPDLQLGRKTVLICDANLRELGSIVFSRAEVELRPKFQVRMVDGENFELLVDSYKILERKAMSMSSAIQVQNLPLKLKGALFDESKMLNLNCELVYQQTVVARAEALTNLGNMNIHLSDEGLEKAVPWLYFCLILIKLRFDDRKTEITREEVAKDLRNYGIIKYVK